MLNIITKQDELMIVEKVIVLKEELHQNMKTEMQAARRDRDNNKIDIEKDELTGVTNLIKSQNYIWELQHEKKIDWLLDKNKSSLQYIDAINDSTLTKNELQDDIEAA